MRHVFLGWAALCWALMGVAPASAQVTISRKYVEGEERAQSVDVLTKQSLTINGANIETSSQQNMVVRAKVGRRNAAGELPVEYAVESLQQTIKAPGLGEVSFDSVNPDKASESDITPLLKAAAQAKWVMTLDREDRVLSVLGREKAFEGLDDKQRETLKALLDPELLKKQAQEELDRVPSRPLKAGETWELEETRRLDGGQSLTFTRRYCYVGETEQDGTKLHRIDVTASKVVLAIEGGGAVAIRLVKSDLKPVKSSGTLLVDPATGWVVAEKHSTQIKGSVVISVAGQELPTELDLLIENSAAARR
ncbi:MAG: hypothetical protein RLY70_753 [Planctomycetota bacterium]|jgi:hypothetical protein